MGLSYVRSVIIGLLVGPHVYILSEADCINCRIQQNCQARLGLRPHRPPDIAVAVGAYELRKTQDSHSINFFSGTINPKNSGRYLTQ